MKKGEVSFILWFFLIFLGTLSILAAMGLLPNELMEETSGNFNESGSDAEDQPLVGTYTSVINAKPGTNAPSGGITGATATTTAGANQRQGILPVRLVIPAINVDTVVLNPTSTSSAKLDAELLRGPVRYPGSGTVGSGNMFIFGHSTGWSVVQNRAYKVFNKINTLEQGDIIYVKTAAGAYSPERTFEYRVRLVTEVNKNDTMITFDTNVNMLTLSTCDSFGAKSDRFVVTADFIGEKAI